MNFFRSLIVGALAIIVGTTIVLAANQSSFGDVPASDRNSEAINYVKTQGIVNGYTDGTFKPVATINRAEFTKIVTEAQFTDAEIQNCLTQNVQPGWNYVFLKDVAKDAWYAPYVCVAKSKNIVGGYSDGTFRPSQNISLVEAAKIISNTFGYQVTQNASAWYKPFVEAIAARRAIPATILDFDKNITRGEMAEMIWRLKDDIKTKEAVTYNDLTLERHNQTVSANTTYNDHINVKEGNVTIEDNVTINGNILIAKGNLTIANNVTINGFVRLVEGNIKMGSNITITGDFITERGSVELGHNNTFAAVETLLGDFNLGDNNTFNGIVQVGNKNVEYGDHVPVGNFIAGGDNNTFKDLLKTPKGNITLGDNTSVEKSIVTQDGNVIIGDNVTVNGDIQAPKGTIDAGDNATIKGQADSGKGLSIGANAYIAKKSAQTQILKSGANAIIGN